VGGRVLSTRAEKKARLRYYTSRLSSIEINASFYRKPRLEVVQSWAAQAPADFRPAAPRGLCASRHRTLGEADRELKLEDAFVYFKHEDDAKGPAYAENLRGISEG